MTQYTKYLQTESFLQSLNAGQNATGAKNPSIYIKRMRFLLKLAGNPDKRLRIIHVAGTSGKGTVCNGIYNLLLAAKKKTGMHVSPFVSVSTEKIQANGKFISANDFYNLVEEVKPLIEKCKKKFGTPSYFEIWFLLSLKYFEKQKCEFAVLETGCGGRYDASNSVFKPVLSIITNVGIDHQKLLGKTIPEIAWQKAGIIRKNGIVISGAERRTARKVIEDEARKQRAKLFFVHDLIDPNTAIVRTAGKLLGIDFDKLPRDWNAKKLAARFEIMQTNPLVILDGAHNADKLAYLTERLRDKEIERFRWKNLQLIVAMTENRNAATCFKPLLKLSDKVYCTQFVNPFRKPTKPALLAKKLKTKLFFESAEDALNAAIKNAKKNDLILVTGSFFLCSDLRKLWYSEKEQIEKRNNW
jgi:dihydrofolate synthase/folylpolyglutamate synthase